MFQKRVLSFIFVLSFFNQNFSVHPMYGGRTGKRPCVEISVQTDDNELQEAVFTQTKFGCLCQATERSFQYFRRIIAMLSTTQQNNAI